MNDEKSEMNGFCASDFEVVTDIESPVYVYCNPIKIGVRFKSEDNRRIWHNLVTERHVDIERQSSLSEPVAQNIILRHTLARFVVYDKDTRETILFYPNEGEGLKNLATTNVLEGFATAVNEVTPKAQERAEMFCRRDYFFHMPKTRP